MKKGSITPAMLHHDPVFLLVVEHRSPTYRMMHTTFKEWLAQRDEGFLLPDRPPLKGTPKINTTPVTDARRKRLHPKKVQPSKPFKPTVQMVKEIVPNKMIPKLGILPTR